MTFRSVAAAAATAAMLAASPAYALLADFTLPEVDTGDFPTEVPSIAITVGGVTFTVSAMAPDMVNANDEITDPGGVACSTLACDTDGIGINGDDEVLPDQMLIVDISEVVEVTAIYYLDLFFVPGGTDQESALVDFGNNGSFDAEHAAQEAFASSLNGFGAFGGLSVTTDAIKFTPGELNDEQGMADFALAGIEFNLIEEEPVIPVPAALPLMLTGVAGLVLFRRRLA